MTGTLVDRRSAAAVAGRVERAAGPIGRTVGLLGRRELAEGEGMWFDGCSAVHTFGMRMTIDVIFLDRSGTVLKVASNLRPWRVASAAGGSDVVELAAGACARAGIAPGSQLEMQWHSST